MIEPASPTKSANHIAIFQESSIRRVWHNDAWWFSVVDVCAILTASPDAGAYWRKLKQRLNAEGGATVKQYLTVQTEGDLGRSADTMFLIAS